MADGTKIAYSAWGRRDGTPVLMIQGLGMDGRGWALQRGAFGRRHRCLAPDNRGTGDSDAPPGPYDLSEMARDAIAVLDAEGIDRAHVVGASMGGVIAQIIGVMHPDRVRSLTLACTSCRHHDWRRELFAEWANAVNERGMGALSDDAMRWLIGPRLQRRFGVFVNVLARVLMQTKPSAFVAQVDAILDAREELRMELPRITRADARHHRLAGHAHTTRRRGGAGRAHSRLAACSCCAAPRTGSWPRRRTCSTTSWFGSSTRSTACAPRPRPNRA